MSTIPNESENIDEVIQEHNPADDIKPDPLNQGTENLSNKQYIHLDKDEVVRAIIYYTAIKYTAAALNGEVAFGFEFDDDIVGLFRNMPETKIHMGGALVMIDNETILKDMQFAKDLESGRLKQEKGEDDESQDKAESEREAPVEPKSEIDSEASGE